MVRLDCPCLKFGLDKCIIGAEMEIGPWILCTTFCYNTLQLHDIKCLIRACLHRYALAGQICSGVLIGVRLHLPTSYPCSEFAGPKELIWKCYVRHGYVSPVQLSVDARDKGSNMTEGKRLVVLKRAIMLARSCSLGIMTKKYADSRATTFPLKPRCPPPSSSAP